MPGEVLPMALIRPLSGGGASGVMNDLFTTYGPNREHSAALPAGLI